PLFTYTLSLHDALPIYPIPLPPALRFQQTLLCVVHCLLSALVTLRRLPFAQNQQRRGSEDEHEKEQLVPHNWSQNRHFRLARRRSEEHTSELQSRFDLV